MTNQEKQQRKALASTVSPETARTNIKEHQPALTQEAINAIEGFQNKLDKKLGDLKKSHNLTGEDMFDLFCPYLSGPNSVSRICPPPGSKAIDQRHVNTLLMAAMFYIFKEEFSVDELLKESFQNLPKRKPFQK